MLPSRKVFATLGQLNSFGNESRRQYNGSTEQNMATLVAKKMFTNYNSSLLREHTVNQSFIAFYRV